MNYHQTVIYTDTHWHPPLLPRHHHRQGVKGWASYLVETLLLGSGVPALALAGVGVEDVAVWTAGLSGLLTAVTATLQVLHHHQTGALLLTLAGLDAAPAQHDGHLLLLGQCGHTVLVPPVATSAALHYLNVCRGHLEYIVLLL